MRRFDKVQISELRLTPTRISLFHSFIITTDWLDSIENIVFVIGIKLNGFMLKVAIESKIKTIEKQTKTK